MKDEYDFSKGERGKFFRDKVNLVSPLHLDPDHRRSVEIGRMVRDAASKLLRAIKWK